ncbi:MAG: Maf family protein [Firmicutes bacterium]|nr:Maf family protein [Bacillota bacterium]MCL2770844.1 Maf family protein [Bacillota bacterium]
MTNQERFNKGETITFSKPTIVLGSGSPQRKDAMERAGIPFEVIVSTFDDGTVNFDYQHANVSKKQNKLYAMKMSEEKIKPFIGKIINGAVVTADCTVLCDGIILEKPLVKEKLIEIHRFISGKTVYVFTSYSVYYNGKVVHSIKISPVKVMKLSEEIIEKIGEDKKALLSAGFRIAGDIGDWLKICKTDYFNIHGLCPKHVKKQLKKVGFPG